jgi:Tol biopolymer transport system component
MAFAAGSRLGPYEIESALGAGGMGEVYRARDTRLARSVAIKVLPESFSSDAARVARFEREAQLLASVNHPNIAAIHDVATIDAVRFLVLELVAGETLQERLGRGALDIDEALEVARQIAEALEAAHERGIIHRDLKPANVKITPEGTVKVLDFGLAKDLEPRGGALTESPTLSLSATQPGVILGTVAYMSPEQTRGKPVDKRADIWAFGCVLYECLTGRSPFTGDSIADLFAAVVKQEPDWSALPRATPRRIRELLSRCLEKDPRQRLRDIGDARIVITRAGDEPAVPPARRSAPWLRIAAAALGSAALAALVTWALLRGAAPGAAPLHLSIAVPHGINIPVTGTAPMLAISPDGTTVVFVGQKAGISRLHSRRLDSGEAVALEGTEGASTPFFSPDGQWVGFFAGGKLRKASIGGRMSLTICEAGTGFGAVWCPDDTIVFSPTVLTPLRRVAASGGPVRAISIVDSGRGEATHRWPAVLPDGRIVFSTGQPAGFTAATIAVLPSDGSPHRIIMQGGTFPHPAGTGHLLFGRDGALYALPFDPAHPERSQIPVPVVEGVAANVTSGSYHVALSRSGTLVYVPGGSMERELIEVGPQGQARALPNAHRGFTAVSVSPDGKKLVASVSPTFDLWIYDLDRQTLSRFTTEPGAHMLGSWSPDGKEILFGLVRGGPRNLWVKPVDGSGPERPLVRSEFQQMGASWSRDRKYVAYGEIHPQTDMDVLVLDVESGRSRPFVQTPFPDTYPQFSPDGKWIAYDSNESGQYDVYVQAFPGPGARHAISTDGGRRPLWRADGRELYYRRGTRVLAVPVRTSAGFSAGAPRLLFDGPYEQEYDVSADGQKFYMIRRDESTPSEQIQVVLNWFEELRRRSEKK